MHKSFLNRDVWRINSILKDTTPQASIPWPTQMTDRPWSKFKAAKITGSDMYQDWGKYFPQTWNKYLVFKENKRKSSIVFHKQNLTVEQFTLFTCDFIVSWGKLIKLDQAYFYIHSSPPQSHPTSLRWYAGELNAFNIFLASAKCQWKSVGCFPFSTIRPR